MRRISLWTAVLVFGASYAALAQTPANTQKPTLETRQSTGTSIPERARGKRGDRLKKIDANMDGRISREEWPRDAEVFARLDADNDGFLTQEEMRRVKNKAKHGRRQSLQTMDANSDGQITRDEWKGRPQVFDRLDSDQDGIVRTDELKSRRGGRRAR